MWLTRRLAKWPGRACRLRLRARLPNCSSGRTPRPDAIAPCQRGQWRPSCPSSEFTSEVVPAQDESAVKPETQSLENQLTQALARYEALRAMGSVGAGDDLLSATLHELSTSVEELRAASEANREYSDELAAAREALAAERNAFQMLFEYAPDGYLVTNAAGLVLRANRMSGELFGVPRGHLVGKP